MPVRSALRTLAVFGRSFRFSGGIHGLDMFDLDSPVQPVLDVARAGELGSIETSFGAGGFFHVGTDQNHLGAGSLENDDNPAAILDSTWGVPGERWVWLIDHWVACTNSNVTSAILSMSFPALGNAFALRDVLLRNYDNATQFHDPGASTFNIALLPGARFTAPMRPTLIPAGGLIGYRSTATGVVTMRQTCLCWVGPIGVYPPGMA